MTHDKNGNEYAQVYTTKAGDLICTDGSFTCINQGCISEVLYDTALDDFYFECDEGKHFLTGQMNDEGTHYVGVYKVSV